MAAISQTMDVAATYIACLTPPGRGAIAVLAVRGPRAWDVSRELFQPAPPRRARGKAESSALVTLPQTPPLGRFWFGRLGAELRDEVVLAVKHGGALPWVEVQCHGGPEVVSLLMETYAQHGVLACTWQGLEQLGTTPRWQQEILPLLVQAPTARSAAILLDQYQGALVQAITAIMTALDEGQHERAGAELARLAGHVEVGLHLVHPWKVVVAGAPNVGKSSLVNALAGYARCLVSALPGTTRDLVTTTLAFDGWPIELTDTAGLRSAEHSVEEAGIARARDALARADVRLWVLDGSVAPVFPDDKGESWQLVLNKIDLPPAWAAPPTALPVSARTRAGLDELCRVIARRLVPEPPGAGEAVPCTEQAGALIRQAYAAFQAGDRGQVRILLAGYLA
jgi:tRNA modification GTPase